MSASSSSSYISYIPQAQSRYSTPKFPKANYTLGSRSSDDSNVFAGETLNVIILFFMFIILAFNSGVASNAQIYITVSSQAITEKTLLTVSSNLGWIAVVSIILGSVFIWSSKKNDDIDINRYIFYVSIALILILVIQAIFALYVRGAVNGTTIQLKSSSRSNLLISGILSITVALIVLLYLGIARAAEVRS